MRMQHWLDKRASLTPDRIAIIDNDQSFTFRDMRERSKQTARKFVTAGVGKGDPVALLCTNGAHVPELIHAIHYTGATVIPLNVRLTASELAYQLEDSATKLFIFDSPFQTIADELTKRVPHLTGLRYEELIALPEADADVQTYINSEDIHSIMYTSGTTGNPKGVLLSFNNHWSSAIGSALNLGLHENDRWLACVPLFHVSGLSILIRSVIYGMTVVIHDKFDPIKVNHSIKKDNITIVSVVSSMLKRMIDSLEDDRYPQHFRCMLLGGGPVPLPLLETCRERNIPVFQTYGMTETASQIVTLPPENMLSKIGSAGKPLFQSEVKIIREDGSATDVLEAGEIMLRGPNVTRGYFNRPDATAQSIQNDWLATGDIGYLDHDGFLYVLDRRNDLIISGGENVYPAEIESVLMGHPAVMDAGVTGIQDQVWGQVPVAFVKVRPEHSVSEDDIKAYCDEHLAKYKIPSSIHFVDELPRNAANKLLRRELHQWTTNHL